MFKAPLLQNQVNFRKHNSIYFIYYIVFTYQKMTVFVCNCQMNLVFLPNSLSCFLEFSNFISAQRHIQRRIQRHIQWKVEYLRWSFLQKQSTVEKLGFRKGKYLLSIFKSYNFSIFVLPLVLKRDITTVKHLNSGHLQVLKTFSVIERCRLLGGNLKMIVTFVT